MNFNFLRVFHKITKYEKFIKTLNLYLVVLIWEILLFYFFHRVFIFLQKIIKIGHNKSTIYIHS